MDEYIDNIAVPQVREILTRYGNLAVLWWDTPVRHDTRSAPRSCCRCSQLQPGHHHTTTASAAATQGDTETPEQYIPATGFPGRDWETCMTMNDTWGYKSDDHNWKIDRDA